MQPNGNRNASRPKSSGLATQELVPIRAVPSHTTHASFPRGLADALAREKAKFRQIFGHSGGLPIFQKQVDLCVFRLVFMHFH